MKTGYLKKDRIADLLQELIDAPAMAAKRRAREAGLIKRTRPECRKCGAEHRRSGGNERKAETTCDCGA